MKRALVVSGGGCKGAYAVGVLKFLRNRPDFFQNGKFLFDIYLGTSTGALVVPLASIGAMDQLIAFYSGISTDKLLVMHDLPSLVRTGCLFNSFLLDTLIDTVFDAARFVQMSSPQKQVGVSAVCLQTGELKLFTTQPLPANQPHYTTQTIQSRNDLVDAIMASVHQPFFLAPVRIRSAPVNPARHFVDGGVREYAPIQVALDAGATDIMAILLSPEVPEPVNDLDVKSLIDVLQRTVDIFSDDVNLNDVRVPDIMSRGTNYVLAVRQAMVAAGLPNAQIDSLLNPPRQPNPFANRTASRIHVIRPKLPLGGGPGGLRFDPVEMQGMMAKGEVDAAAYFTQLDANGGVPPVVLA